MTTDQVKIISLWGERYVKADEYSRLLILLDHAEVRIRNDGRGAADELLDHMQQALARTKDIPT